MTTLTWRDIDASLTNNVPNDLALDVDNRARVWHERIGPELPLSARIDQFDVHAHASICAGHCASDQSLHIQFVGDVPERRAFFLIAQDGPVRDYSLETIKPRQLRDQAVGDG